jgi:type VI protein secretion system component Hcp
MATNYYLVIHGVSGDYSDKLLTGAFKVSDFEFLTTNNGTTQGGGAGAGKSSFDPLTLTLNSDSYTALLTDLGKGTVISGVSLIGETNGLGGAPQITYDLNLSNVVVTDLLKDTNTTGVDLTLDYNKIGLVTTGIGIDGKLQTPQSFGWDILANKATTSGTELTSSGAPAVAPTAPVRYFLLIDGFNGGSLDKTHTGWFDLSSFNIDASNTSSIQTGGFGGAGKAAFGDLSVTTERDGTGLPGLLADSGPGTLLRGVKIEGVTADGTAVYDLEAANVKIDKIDDTSTPGYTIDFNYSQIGLTTKGESNTGQITPTGSSGWNVATNQSIDPTSLPTLHVGAPCYCPGTLILTDSGEVAVETLSIGDVVMTMSGAARPIKWIGRRSYAGRFAFGRKDILPVCIKAGALDENTPRRDLWISPHHAMFLEEVLIEACDLVNGVSIVQAETVDKVEYFHIELDSHDVLVVEGSFSESFIDDDSRNMFHNAPEYRTLYPADEQGSVRYYAPRLDAGYAVEKARRHIEARAGLRPASGDNAVALRGYVDQVGSRSISGWAQNPDHPEAAVCLDIYAGGRLIGQTLANRYRDDLQQAGLGSGRHGFTPPAGLTFAPDAVEVRRSFDGAALSASGAVRTNLSTVKREPARRIA